MNRKQANIPDAYLKGYIEFYKLKIKVSPNVLIPRPETELLVDETIRFAKSKPGFNIRLLDLGTGSGCVAIAVAKNLPQASIVASDVSVKALVVAKDNAIAHQVGNQIRFVKSDLLAIIPAKSHFEIIVTNLPYIPSARIPYLDPSVKDFEPHLALDGGEDGFRLYRKLFEQIVDKQIKFKLLVGEIDYTHKELAIDQSYQFFPDAQIEVKKDLAYRQRILKINFP